MYEELVGWLRSWSELPANCECYESCEECNKQDICATFTNESIIAKAGEAADAIEQLEQYAELYKDGGEAAKKAAGTYKAAYTAEHEARVAEMPRWCPVTEALPEMNRPCLLYNKYNGTMVGAIIDGMRFRIPGSRFPDTPTHYMPLPQPPEEE